MTGQPAAEALSDPRSLADEDAIRAVEDAPGVHVVYAPGGAPLYAGMSQTTRTRIRQHLTGDRQGSILHDKVGRRLDRQLGRSATREEIRAWLEGCTFAYSLTDDPAAAKAQLMDELQPEFNEMRPSGK